MSKTIRPLLLSSRLVK